MNGFQKINNANKNVVIQKALCTNANYVTVGKIVRIYNEFFLASKEKA